MPRVFAQQHYRQNAETVWQRIQDFSDLSWLPGVTGCNVTGHGVGAIRTVSTKDGGTVKEELVSFDTAQRMFGYRIHFEKELVSKRTNPHTSQDHKPIHKFAVQALEELTKIYDPQ